MGVRWEVRARRSSGIWIVAHAPKLKAVASALAAAPHLARVQSRVSLRGWC